MLIWHQVEQCYPVLMGRIQFILSRPATDLFSSGRRITNCRVPLRGTNDSTHRTLPELPDRLPSLVDVWHPPPADALWRRQLKWRRFRFSYSLLCQRQSVTGIRRIVGIVAETEWTEQWRRQRSLSQLNDNRFDPGAEDSDSADVPSKRKDLQATHKSTGQKLQNNIPGPGDMK